MKRFSVVMMTMLGVSVSLAVAQAQTLTVPMKNSKGEAVGEAKVMQTPNGVLIQADLSQLPPGTHGLHIHETGKCEPPFESAGGHFNPTDKQHGFLDPQGRHVGDLPNIHVSDQGTAKVDVLTSQVTVSEGKTQLLDVDGSALVVHAKPDDYRSEPSGDAGDRIACGVISATAS